MTKQSEVRADVNGEISLADIIGFFRQSWKLITVFGVLGLALSAIYVLIMPAQYEATIQIKMAQYSNSSSSSSIEPPAVLIERLKLPSVYTDDVLRECGVAEGDDVGPYINGRVKASVMKNVTDVIDIKLRSNKPEGAKSCAMALLNMIGSQQQRMIEDMLKGKHEQLERIKEAFINEEKQPDRTRQGGVGVIVYLANLSKLTSLRERMDRLNDEMLFAKLHPTKLVSPIYVPRRPVSPKVPMFVLLGTFAGLVLGVVFAAIRNQYLRLSEQK